ncbi:MULTISPECIES: helix-turn-helix transcriptional regulator [unclassified Crossiella]|uniref:helix-turn-helix transcriptional regulator n=1 Tax=unclassified Crossiella TaxID=2620835 RepID=UPI001FFFE85A|nr:MULTISPECIES: LuxR C-terminal-related transcriptional regulator [unclassified Crossiella]MCK2243762.1 LuxR C-terminal-related transcriptional regulator [Crossiella sp. S99.2]MCK2257621.1 LuxR C-terminal-related transcriptional regulator [Crossiella sp. S99.1]
MGLNVDALRAVDGVPDVRQPQREVNGPPGPPVFEGLGPHAGAVAVAVAVLGPDAPLRDTAELAQLSLPDTLAAVDVLTAAGVLVNQVPLSFRSAETARTVLCGLPVGARITVRLRAAELLRALPGAAERTADQLVLIGPVGLDWAADALRAASVQALDRGDWRAAAEYLRQALAEPLPVAERVDYTQRLAAMLTDTDPLAAVTCLLQELRCPDTPAEVTATTGLLRRLATRLPSTQDVLRLFDEAADRVHQHDPAAAVRLQLTRAGFALFRPGGTTRLSRLERWLSEADLADPVARRGLAAVRSCLAALREPRAGDAIELATAVLAEANVKREWDACWLALSALLLAGDDEATERACRRLDADLPADGAEIQRFGCELTKGYYLRRQGKLRATVSTLDSLLTACAEYGLARNHPIVATAAANLAETLVHTGALRRAEQVLAEYRLNGDIRDTGSSMCLLRGRGAVAAANGDLDTALAAQLDCGRHVTGWAELNAEFLPWRFEAVLTLLRADRHDDAVALAEADQAAATAWGTPRALGFAAYARALTRRGAQRIALLTEAAQHLFAAGAALSEAHARYDLALALHEAGSAEEAVPHLARARELVDYCGAAALGERLGALTPTDRPLLTPQERRIARLVARGHTNTEIAEDLSLARRTVEFHLSSVYRKLAITGRGDLLAWTGPEID